MCSLSAQISDIPSQHIINGSLSVYWSLSDGSIHFPPSSDCRLLNQISLKEPNAVALHDDFGLLQPYTVMVAEKLYTHCVLLSMTVCTVFHYQSHAVRFYPTIIAHVNTQYIKNRLWGSYIALHKYTFIVNKGRHTLPYITFIKCIHYALREYWNPKVNFP
jgi:hypothetical protein